MRLLTTTLIVLGLASNLIAQTPTTTNDSINKLDEVIISAQEIFGSKFASKNRTGSSYYVSSLELEKFNYTDVNRLLKTVPGVSIYEEDGFGLRPNISLRGTSPERSAKISLMEDGVLIAPAPYSAPAAYYFPSVARMEAVEILKGSSQVQYGPFTTGGAINMVSYQIPNEFKAKLDASFGSFNSGRYHVQAGNRHKYFGYGVEYLKFNSNGFKNVDVRGDSGFDIDELLAKVSFNTNPDKKVKQQLELKFQFSDEVSDETYLGLTDSDFADDPFRRYAGSQNDVMNAEHLQLQLNHTLQFSKDIRLTTTGYMNNFKRNWYKLEKVQLGDETQSIANVVGDPETYAEQFAILTGEINSEDGSLILRNNNREYTSRGVQTKLDYHWNGSNTFHDIEVGLRYHFDEEDRFQWEDGYGITDGVMELTNPGTPGTQANRISDARAFAAFTTYRLKWNDWTFTPGVRFESITLSRSDFGGEDVNRTGVNLSERENQLNIFIPGAGFAYRFDNRFSVFGGVHKGFAPPGNKPEEEPEESVNYELGTRFDVLGLSGEVVGFYNDYSNLLGADTNSSGGTGTLEQFNAGEVRVQGIELLLNYSLLKDNEKITIPLSFGYTLTDTEFLNSFGSEDDLWGEVIAGDELPYIAKHQFNVSASFQTEKFEANLNGRLNGAFRTSAGRGAIPLSEEVPNSFIVDVSAKYRINKYFSITGNVINMFDETYAVSRVPAGLRPGHPFGAYAGIQLTY
ncbi:MAG: TonB-dependent receptor [Aureisphaera sp.]